MSNLEPPTASSADFPPEKPPVTEIPGPSTHRANCVPSSTGVEDRHAKVMENFKGMIFKFAIASSATKSLSPMQRSLIEQRLDEVFPSFRTPDHPPYAAMIEAAIQKLDEEGASSKEAISQFIRKEYPNLPWAHDSILKHHLENLCENGSIVKASNGLYMRGHVVTITRHDSAPSPCSSISAHSSLSLIPSCSPSSSSWSSSSYCSSPRLKRKRLLYTKRRKKQGRKRGSKKNRSNKGKVNRLRCAQVPKRRQRRPPKKDVLEEETETNAEHLILEEKSEETEAEKKSNKECNEGAEGINQVRGKRQKIRKQSQREETGLVVEIRLDEHEDMVDEGRRELRNRGANGRKAHPKPTRVPGRSRGRPRKKFLLVEKTQPHSEQMKTDVQDPILEEQTEVPEKKYKINKELAEVVEDHNQLQGNLHETLQLSRADDTLIVHEIGKSGSVGEANKLINQCNFVMEVELQKDESIEERDEKKEHENFEGIEEQSQLEEHNIVPEQDQSNGQKRRGRPLKRSVKRRKVQPKPTRIPGRARGRPRKKDLCVEKSQPNEERMETTDIQDPMLEEKTEVPEQKYETSKELTEVAEEHNQSQGSMHETPEGSPAENTKQVKEIGKSGPVSEENKLIKQCNVGMKGEPQNDEPTKGCDEQKEQENFPGSEEKTQFEEPNIVPKQGQRNEQKRWGQLLNRGAKGRKVHLKHSRIPGRAMGGPRKKDFLVEETQANAEQTEATDIHDSRLEENTEVPDKNCEINKECTEAVEDCSELKGNMCGTLEWSRAEKIKMVKEVRKPGPVAEENLPIKQHSFVMEGERQKDWGIKGFSEQKEHENAFDEEQNQSAKEKNEITFGENQPRRQENEEQNQQLEKHMQSVTEKEVEVPEMHGQNIRLQENSQPEGQYESITKALLQVDVAERSMGCKAIVLPEQSFVSVLEGKEISNKSMEQQREIPGKEKVFEIVGRQTEVVEQKPESSTAGKSQLKSVEISSQPQCLLQQQPQHAEERPLDGQLRSRSPKSFSSCGML